MKNQCVSTRQLAGVGNDGVGIVDGWVNRQAPAFMTNDATAVFTRGLCIVDVAVIQGTRALTGLHAATVDQLPRGFQ